MKGFTLVELLVSIAIFTGITTVAIFNHSQFNGSVLLTNLAYEIALSIRQSQYYGVSVKQSSAGNNFDSGYGIHVNTNTPTQYTIFEDKTGGTAFVFDSISDPVVHTYTIAKGNKISRVCVSNTSTTCRDAGTNSNIDVTFIRPNPDAYIKLDGASTKYSSVQFCVASPQGLKRRITVESTGQISVGNDTAPQVCN